jgi:uncharacterized membrane protein
MRRKLLRSAAVLFALIGAAGQPASAAPTIFGIGNTPNGGQTFGSGLSGNGTTVVGTATDPTTLTGRAFRWTAATGAQDIGPGDATVSSSAFGGSADGSVVVGAYGAAGSTNSQALRWTSATGSQGLGFLQGGNNSIAYRTSSNGAVVVGQANDATTLRSFRWTSSTGMQALPAPAGFTYSEASGVSADGSVIAGTLGNKGGISNIDRAYRYTDAGGYQDLGVQAGYTRSAANNISGDGNTVVGLSQLLDPVTGGSTHGFRWTASTGLVPLFFANELGSYASSVNFDGSRIVGTTIGATGSHAALWTSKLGSLDLNTYLPTQGVNLTGWTLTSTVDISADGSVMMGDGMFNGVDTTWVVTGIAVPEPSALLLTGLGGVGLILAPRRTRRIFSEHRAGSGRAGVLQ